jgi:hypothetical protein
MPTTFIDGPAAGAGMNLRRAPVFLRVVEVIEQMGTFDALDQLEDEPREGERVHVYRMLAGTRGSAFVCGRGSGASGHYEWGIYAHLADVDGEQLRDTAAWRAWVEAQVAAEVPQ